MDGTALFVTVASIFIAQMNDIPLNAGDYAIMLEKKNNILFCIKIP